MKLFEFSQSIFCWTLINFVLILFLVHKFALPRFYTLLEEREKKRQSVIDELDKNLLESKKSSEEYFQKLSLIQQEAKEILKSAQKEKENIKKEVFAQAMEEKQKILDAVKEEITIEKKKFVEDMKNEAVELVVECTEKVIKKNLSSEDHYRVIRDNLDSLSGILEK